MAKDFAKAFYHSKQWKSVRRQVLDRDLYTCQECYSRAEEVHHIKELTPANIDDWNIALNPNNLKCLCHKCHTKITAGNIGDVDMGYIFDEDGQVIKRE